MTLIQTVIEPDTWEQLGGNSTMFPYAQGIVVNADGIVSDLRVAGENDESINRNADLIFSIAGNDHRFADESIDAWKNPAAMRCVSLGRLLEHFRWLVENGRPIDAAALHLAGISKIDALVLVDGDVRILGPVGAIRQRDHYFVDADTGGVPIELMSMVAAARLVSGEDQMGCTIDPTREGLAAAMSVAAEVQSGRLAIGKAPPRMAEALGMQNVSVWGIEPDTPLAYRMIHADRHMKELALNKHEMPDGVPNYLDQIDRHIADGVPKDLLLRLWFNAEPVAVSSDASRRVFRWTERPIKLSVENKVAGRDGSRGAVRHDPRSTDFVRAFNDNFTAIRSRYPVYGSLESLYNAVVAMRLIADHGNDSDAGGLVRSFADMTPHGSVELNAPRRVPSIAVLHTSRKGSKRHQVLVASGGVAVSASNAVNDQIETYPGLKQTAVDAGSTPRRIDRWWWNL